MKSEILAQREGWCIRPAHKEDALAYYLQNYCPLDAEVARLTGCKPVFSQEEVTSFFLQSLEDDARRFFLICDPQGHIAGETVISDIDEDLRSASFRIALFRPTGRDRGIGTWAASWTRDHAFGALGLHRLELEVYSLNPRAQQVYRKIGFRQEGVLRDAVRDGVNYADVILMSILEDEWRTITGQ